jgi:hypothetical protein
LRVREQLSAFFRLLRSNRSRKPAVLQAEPDGSPHSSPPLNSQPPFDEDECLLEALRAYNQERAGSPAPAESQTASGSPVLPERRRSTESAIGSSTRSVPRSPTLSPEERDRVLRGMKEHIWMMRAHFPLAMGCSEWPAPNVLPPNVLSFNRYRAGQKIERLVRQGPVLFEGVVLRAFAQGGSVQSQVWKDGSWGRGGTFADVFNGTPLSPEELAEPGIPLG